MNDVIQMKTMCPTVYGMTETSVPDAVWGVLTWEEMDDFCCASSINCETFDEPEA